MDFLRHFITIIFNILSLAIFARVLLSWVRINPDNPVVRLIFEITEPILAPIRSVVPQFGMFDISPIVAILAIELVHQLISALLK